MFLAFSAAIRSADLSRQVGAIITKNNEIISTGANDAPKFGGGLYWPEYDNLSKSIVDKKDGRDYRRGIDANQNQQEKIINEILKLAEKDSMDSKKLGEILAKSRIRDITEYGRVVHAEMEALLNCARSQSSTREATLYCTTFPCHNCAKHIVAAGIKRVVYVEPYEKSLAQKLHDDSISLGYENQEGKVKFESFVGIGPRRFFDLFSMNLGSGFKVLRKSKDGKIIDWKRDEAKLRISMKPLSYLDVELIATREFNKQSPEVSNE